MALVRTSDFDPAETSGDASESARARWRCERLEAGQVLYFDTVPFDFPEADRQFLVSQRQSGSGLHKNISYRPRRDVLRGYASGKPEEVARAREIMRRYSAEVTRFLSGALAPYAAYWSLDYASFRPEEEAGRDLPLHKRNDLLHVDAFPTRPTHGGRILRCFTNINPTASRVWTITDRLPALANRFAREAGLNEIAQRGPLASASLLGKLQRLLGVAAAKRSAYDAFMLRFHDYLKENSGFQETCPKIRLEFPPGSTWICYTDYVPHAVLSGRYALEQTFIVPVGALVTPAQAPIRVLERLAGRPLAPVSAN